MKIQVLVFMNEIKFDLTLKKNNKFSVSFMLLFAIIKLLPTLRLSSENLTFLFFLPFRINLVLISMFWGYSIG